MDLPSTNMKKFYPCSIDKPIKILYTKSMRGFIVFLICLAWLWGLYYGYTLLVTRSLKSAPTQEKSVDQTRQENEQRQKRQDSLQQQKNLMRDRQRTMRQYQNR